jgi:hypothetical protein
MMATFTTTKDDGTHLEISLNKTGDNNGTITVKEWSKDKDPKKDKTDKKEEHKLKNIKANKDGSKMTAKNDGFFNADVEITFNRSKPPEDPTITIKVTNTFMGEKDSTTTYTISEEDQNTILNFLKNSNFPLQI